MKRLPTRWNIFLVLTISGLLTFIYFSHSIFIVTWSANTFKNVQPQVRISTNDDLNREPTIPHIIHQAWGSYQVPRELWNWIESWLAHNPTWEYWLWTMDDARALIAHRYPEYLDLFNEYHYNIFRYDAMRYFLMDTYGGFYVDIDMECYKPLDVWTYDHQCLLSHETYEHPYLLFNKSSPNVMTTIMACRPGHPFFKQVIASLPQSFRDYPTDVLNGTGPFFLDRNFRIFNQSGEGILAPTPKVRARLANNTISVVPPGVFLPTYDPIMKDGFRMKCNNHLRLHNPLASKTCVNLQERNFSNVPTEDSYTDHHWVHMFLDERTWAKKVTVRINTIIPNVRTYEKMG